MVGSQFGSNSINPLTQPALSQQPWWGMMSQHPLGLGTTISHRLNTIAFLNVVADQLYPFQVTICHLLKATFSMMMNHDASGNSHLKLVS